MKVKHTVTIVGQCPKGCTDVYQAEFFTENLVMVEEIAEAIKIASEVALTQEELTQRLAEATDCRVVTTGRHGVFETVVEAEACQL